MFTAIFLKIKIGLRVLIINTTLNYETFQLCLHAILLYRLQKKEKKFSFLIFEKFLNMENISKCGRVRTKFTRYADFESIIFTALKSGHHVKGYSESLSHGTRPESSHPRLSYEGNRHFSVGMCLPLNDNSLYHKRSS